jgi:hypothetical protein
MFADNTNLVGQIVALVLEDLGSASCRLNKYDVWITV